MKDGSGRRSTKTVPRSFRIDERALEVLQDEAQRRRINPSSLINQFVVAYSEYGRFAEQMGAISLSRQTFMEILNATPEGALIEAAQHAGKSAVPTFIGAMHGRVSVQTIRQLMEVLSTHAHLYEFNEMNDSYGLHWTLVHGFGMKWSIFLSNYFGEAFAMAGARIKSEFSERSVIFWP